MLSHGAILRESLMPTVRADRENPKNSRVSLSPLSRGINCTSFDLKDDGLLKFYSRLRNDVVGLKVVNHDLDLYFEDLDL